MISMSERASPTAGTSGAAQLHQRLGLLGDLEADLQPLRLEGARHREHDVGLFGGRAHEQVEVHVEVERLQRVAAAALSPWAISRLDPKLTSPRGRYGRPSRAAV